MEEDLQRQSRTTEEQMELDAEEMLERDRQERERQKELERLKMSQVVTRDLPRPLVLTSVDSA